MYVKGFLALVTFKRDRPYRQKRQRRSDREDGPFLNVGSNTRCSNMQRASRVSFEKCFNNTFCAHGENNTTKRERTMNRDHRSITSLNFLTTVLKLK